jgi:DNA modification methylase
MLPFSQNELYNKDCLSLLKELVSHRGEFIDLIYTDPPFNSKKDRYNDKGELSFIDTWTNVPYKDVLEELKELDCRLHDLIKMIVVSEADLSYLTNLCTRILYMHKVLKKTGSFYLHCDPTMSHYIKIVCDHIFGKQNFKNEIVWERSASKSSKAKSLVFPRNHDVILFYTKSKSYTFNKLYTPYSKEYIKAKFTQDDDDGRGRYRWNVLATYSEKRLSELQEAGIVKKSDDAKNYSVKQYLSESPGIRVSSVWKKEDININSMAPDKNGYPTQKPVGLVDLIIKSSSKPGDLFFDAFCGSGSSLVSAEVLGRKWVGCDVNLEAIKLCEKRIKDIGGEFIRFAKENHNASDCG